MVAVWVTLAVLLVIYLLLLLPIKISADLTEEPLFTIRYLFFKFKIYPTKEKTKKHKRVKKSKKTTAHNLEKPKPKKHHGPSYYIDKYGDVIKAVLSAAGKLLKHVIIKRLLVNIIIGGEDAAETAVEYGAVCAVAYPLVSLLESKVTVHNRELNIKPDFDAAVSKGELCIDARIKVLHVVTALAGLLKSIIKYNIK